MIAVLDFLQSYRTKHFWMAQFLTRLVHAVIMLLCTGDLRVKLVFSWVGETTSSWILLIRLRAVSVFQQNLRRLIAAVEQWRLRVVCMSQSKNKAHANVSKYTMCGSQCVICWLVQSERQVYLYSTFQHQCNSKCLKTLKT